MDNKNEWSESELKIKNEFQQIYDDYLFSQDEKKPEPDLTFIMKQYKSSSLINRVSKVAVIFLTVMVLSSGIAIWINSEQATATKFKLDKIMYEIKDGGGNDKTKISTSDEVISYKTTTLEDIDEAKKFYSALYVPSYIPDEYVLQKLQIDKLPDEEYFVDYSYTNPEGHIINIIINTSSNPGTLEIAAKTEIIQLDNTELYVWDDSTSENLRGVCLLDNKTLLSISGVPDQEMMIDIISSFSK